MAFLLFESPEVMFKFCVGLYIHHTCVVYVNDIAKNETLKKQMLHEHIAWGFEVFLRTPPLENK